MAKPGWYGVATKCGYMVCNTWDEVQLYLKAHSGVELHAKFPTEDKALEFGRTQHRILVAAGSPSFGIAGAGMELEAPTPAAHTSATAGIGAGGAEDDEPPW